MNARDEKKRAFDKWVLVPISAASVFSAVASWSTKGLLDAAKGQIDFNLSNAVAPAAAIFGAGIALIFAWQQNRQDRPDH